MEGESKVEVANTLRANLHLRKAIKSLPDNPKSGSGVFYYNNPRDLFDRLQLLGGSIRAGKNAAVNELSEVAHTLHKR